MKKRKQSPIVLLVSRAFSPYLMLLGLYVVFHGHYSPGGGFQGGALLAASVILVRLTAGRDISELQFKRRWALIWGSVGILIYMGTGVVAMLWGGQFLDYGYLPYAHLEEPIRRYYGILIVEIGVSLAVMGVLIGIFDQLLEGASDE